MQCIALQKAGSLSVSGPVQPLHQQHGEEKKGCENRGNNHLIHHIVALIADVSARRFILALHPSGALVAHPMQNRLRRPSLNLNPELRLAQRTQRPQRENLTQGASLTRLVIFIWSGSLQNFLSLRSLRVFARNPIAGFRLKVTCGVPRCARDDKHETGRVLENEDRHKICGNLRNLRTKHPSSCLNRAFSCCEQLTKTRMSR